jgi:hypothetical protein
MDLKEVEWRCMGWIDLAPDRDSWQALAKAVMHFGFHKIREIY